LGVRHRDRNRNTNRNSDRHTSRLHQYMGSLHPRARPQEETVMTNCSSRSVGLTTMSTARTGSATREKSSEARPAEDDDLRMHHKGCGGWRETTPEFAEIVMKRRTAGRTDRRKPGVKWRSAEAQAKNNLRICLTENGAHKILPLRQSLPSSSERSSVPPSIRTPE
jgi:hypothetical protein